MNAEEYWAEQRAVMIATERLNLANTVRNRHAPEALTEPIDTKEAE